MNVQSPIGKLILRSYQESEILKDPILEEKLENLIDLIKFRTVNKGFEQTSHSLQNELFYVRFELLSLLLSQPEILQSLQDRILEEIAEKYFLKGPNKQLGLVVSDALEVYLEMFSKLADLISEQEKPADYSKVDIPSFEAFKRTLSFQPNPEFTTYYLKWLESSLNFDYLLIVADFFLYKEIELDAKQVKELEGLVKKSIVDFASYSAVTGYWDFQKNKSIPYFEEISKRISSLQEPPISFSTNRISKKKEKSAHNFAGLWSKEDADLIEKAIQEGCEQIDEDGWK